MKLFRREAPPELYKGDPLWTVVMSQLKTRALCLSPYFRENGLEVNTAEGYAQFETFISQLEDSYDLTRQLFLKRSALKTTNLTQIAEDVGENYTRRFGSLTPSSVLLLVDAKLPTVQAHPQVVMRIVDCFVRAAERLGRDNAGFVAIRPSTAPRSGKGEILIQLAEVSLEIDTQRCELALERFRTAKYAQCIHDLGLDLCAGLHLASQIGGVASLVIGANGKPTIELRIPFDIAAGSAPRVAGPQAVYVSSGNPLFIKRMEQLASFHWIRLATLPNGETLPEGTPVIFDASETGHWQPVPRALEGLPRSTVFVVASGDSDAAQTLAKAGFSRFTTFPIVSTKLLRLLGNQTSIEIPAAAHPAHAGTPKRVLIVDDTETARIVIREHLESRGHTVTEAFDGTEFVDLVQRGEAYDLVFCDVTMCHLDGVAALRVIRELESASGTHLPVVLMTAYGSVDESGMSDGGLADEVLAKPLGPADIDRMLTQFLTPAKSASRSGSETEVIALDDLKGRCGGKIKTVIRVLDSFLNTSSTLRPRLQQLDAAADAAAVGKVLHTVKGLLREVGARKGAEALEQYELKLREKRALDRADLDAVDRWIDETARDAERMKRQLETEAG